MRAASPVTTSTGLFAEAGLGEIVKPRLDQLAVIMFHHQASAL